MRVTVHSFAKINLGLSIGPLRADGYHELRTVYQTIGLHDVLRVSVARGTGIEIRSADPRVPCNESNTCWRIAEKTMTALRAKGRVFVEIEKRLPVQGGLGGASGNAVSAMLALERALRKRLPSEERLRIAAEVGSDLPLFLIGGAVLGVGHGEEVYPLPDFAAMPCVVALPEIAVSTPEAFADWDAWVGQGPGASSDTMPSAKTRASAKLTVSAPSDRMVELGRRISAGLSGLSGVPGSWSGGRAENPLLDLVRTGIENDFERVVFPKYPELREVKSLLEKAGALYASLSGSGSALYGLFRSRTQAEKAAARLRKQGTAAVVATTLTRRQYWKMLLSAKSE